MKTLIKRLIAILLIIFVPVFFVSLLSSLVVHGICSLVLNETLAEGGSISKTAIFLYRSYMSYLWWLLIIAAILIDSYFYIFKGYRYNKFIFYGIKALLVFIVFYFFVNIFFQDDFASDFSAYQQNYIPHYIYMFLFITAILASAFVAYVIHELHSKWILPKYMEKIKAKE